MKRPMLVEKPRPKPDPTRPRCPLHGAMVRESDGYCWVGAHYVPPDQWVYRSAQMSMLREGRQGRLEVNV